MATHIIVVENHADWKPGYPENVVVTVKDYLSRQDFLTDKEVRVINLCRSYKYSSLGYYCSLLAEARGHKVIPSVRTILDISSKSIYGLETEDLDEQIQKSVKKHRANETENRFDVDIFFGRCDEEALQDVARQIFETFPTPLLRVEFELQEHWRIASIKPLYLNGLDAGEQGEFSPAINSYLRKRWRTPKAKSVYRYDLAVLHNPHDRFSPSTPRALQNFIRAGKTLGMDVDLIEKKDYSRLAEYDALFIRDTTWINHYTYRFAKKAESEGMVVIDDPDSILKCTNKVYLAELLKANRIPTPKTVIVHKGNAGLLQSEIAYPVVLKIPDGSFSRGVYKADDKAELDEITTRLFKESDLILGQEFAYTEFDWRIGILNREAIFACQYFMSKKHWQVVNHGSAGRFTEGGWKTMAIEDAPQEVVRVALDAANLIGDGLYGVDLKQNENGVFVIEVNDNPNIDTGVEDAVLKDGLYRMIMQAFVDRLDRLLNV
jgi:glutathione synthase/RimK-type ligase-like ATP-grasp enzyme